MRNGEFTAWIKSLMAGNGNGNGTERSPSEAEAEPEPEDRTPVALFSCRNCSRTYICEEMEACPECGQEVECVPNERELGLV